VLDTPVTGGNVSFYNETPVSAVFPTPTIGMLGLVENVARDATTADFKADGDVILYVGALRKGLGGSEYLNWCHKLVTGDAPSLDLEFEKNLQQAVLGAIRSGLVASAHDVSDGGLAVTLAESCLFGGRGATVDLSALGGATRETLFSEAQSGIVLSCAPGNAGRLMAHFEVHPVPCYDLGRVGGVELAIAGIQPLRVAQLADLHGNAIRIKMQ